MSLGSDVDAGGASEHESVSLWLKYEQDPSVMRQAIHSLYVLKAIGAFLVVACHIPMTGGGALLSTLLNVAVPIFYAISGYFLYAPDAQQSLRRALSSARKLVPVILIVNLIHFLWLLPQHADMALGVDLVKLLVYGDALIGHLWYLNAMLWAMLILALLLWGGGGYSRPVSVPSWAAQLSSRAVRLALWCSVQRLYRRALRSALHSSGVHHRPVRA